MSQLATESGPGWTSSLTEEVDAHLARILDDLAPDLASNLLDAMRYSVLGDGKRLRPILTLLSCDAAGGRRADALGPAAALELVHTFSLVHDDLPAMDDDDTRRGKPTLHIHAGPGHAGEAMAVLAGDCMLSTAFLVIARSGLSAESATAICSELAHATNAMIAGQVLDTLGGFPAGLTEREKLELIHHNKTGALIRAACRMGAICANADGRTLEALTRYGEAVGLMFQIVDDLLDVTQESEHLGKAAGKDKEAGKITFPGVLGVEASRAEIHNVCRRAHEALAPFGERADRLIELCDYMAVRTR